MTILSKAAILAAADLKTEDVEVPEWGGSVRVAVMSGLARDNWISRQGDGKVPYSVFTARVLVSTVVDEDGQPVFDEADIETLRGKNQAAMDRVLAVALRLNGLAATAVEEAEKNSDAAQSGDFGSGSPSPSESQ
ncbi:phage tail assembly chaperone [Cupriavidus campinensis]|jgi:hypothetical protein|uniref:Phage tail assembly chaperone n=1 Tax=Cupriavidus campinensis TaxID=151783 RepID=A0AAE9L154_9BURK|nr:phage tail assembly chaperone [Cupriavidus campinensis]URF02969.1 phage tail assembly chaperone [Cupriavidus campinensis]URF05486.1 phage tail assembly chaperone [Cupriavidus campinensis]